MPERCFLGANSHQGFYSLYGGFVCKKGDMLHIIKGGPGTGKSGFMRAMAEAAEARGLRAERVLCSGDPDSLDGVYIPELHMGWVDGTAPHVTEPGIPGVDGNYVNLWQFCRMPFDSQRAERIRRLNGQYKELYRQAYCALAAAEELSKAAENPWDMSKSHTIKGRISSTVRRWAAGDRAQGQERECFMSAISCRGQVRLTEDVKKLCKQIYVIGDDGDTAAVLLEYARREAAAAGEDVLLCLSPLNPGRLEGIILLEGGLGIFNSGWQFDESRGIRLESMRVVQDKAQRQETRRVQRFAGAAQALAVERLGAAKALHDELEAEYGAQMDFAALTEFTKYEVKRIFGS